MKEAQEKTVLLVTLGVFALAFFSYNVQLSTGNVTASSGHYDCRDVRFAADFLGTTISPRHSELFRNSQFATTRYSAVRFDANRDNIIDQDDVDLITADAQKYPCPQTENECAEEGRTRCDNLGNFVICMKDSTGRLVNVVKPCPSGQSCQYKTGSYDSTFANAKPPGISRQLRFGQCM